MSYKVIVDSCGELTEDMKNLTGGQVIINGDAKESADILEQIVMEKRQGLNI